MHIISKILSGFLVLTISGITLAFILSATLFSADYYKAKATQLNLYDQLAKSIPDTLSHDDPSIKPALEGIVSSAYIQQKLNPYLDQFQKYYFDNGPAPQIDFSDFAAEAQAQGLTIPPESNISKPIVFQDPTGFRKYASNLTFMKTWGILIALLLAAGIVAINKGYKRFSALGFTLLTAAVWEGVLFLLFKIAPGLLESLLKSNNQVGPIGPVLIQFFKAVLGDISQDFGIVAIGLAIAGIVAMVAGLILRNTGRFFHHDKGEPPRFTRPNPDNRPSLH